MKHPALARLGLLALFALLLEFLCWRGSIDKLTMQPPHRMLENLVEMLVSGRLDGAIAKTMGNAAIAFAAAMTFGVASAFLLHRMRNVRATLDPLFAVYYAVPVFAFYPLFIILFGLNDMPEIVIGFMLAVIAVIVTVLNGLDKVPRVLLKAAYAHGFGGWETARRVTLPYVAPYVLTGAKLALAYALIGVIGAEFIMSTSGMGYEISFAYNNFDNATMYPLILLIIFISVGVNAIFSAWERILMTRRGLG